MDYKSTLLNRNLPLIRVINLTHCINNNNI